MIKFSILGDKKYANFVIKNNIYSSKYLYLHSYYMCFFLFKKKYSLRAKIPHYFYKILKKYFLAYYK